MTTRTAGGARVLLCALLASVLLSPRLRLDLLTGDQAPVVDLRLQDLLLGVALGHLLLLPPGPVRPSMRLVWGRSVVVFLPVGLAVLYAHLLVDDLGTFRRVAFAGRSLEIFVLAAVVAALHVRIGEGAWRSALRALHLAIGLNVVWVGYQYVTGARRTLLGDAEVSAAIESYGPKLVGEASAFGTGQFFAFVAALALAEHRARVVRRPFPALLMAVAVVGVVLSGSRISLGVVVLLATAMLSTGRSPRQLLHPVGVTFAVLLAVPVAVLLPPYLSGRTSLAGVRAGLEGRTTTIWQPLYDTALSNLAVGVGPGGLVPPLRSEAHNVLLRAWLDFGLVGGALFLAVFVVVLRRSLAAARAPEASPPLRLLAALALFATGSVLVSGLVQDALTAVTSTHLTMLAVGLFAGEASLEAARRAGAGRPPPPRHVARAGPGRLSPAPVSR